MAKAFKVFFLLTLIGAAAVYAFFYYSLNLQPPDNVANRRYRPPMITRPWLRKIFRLHQVGDARFDYATDQNYSRLKIIVYLPIGEILQPQTMARFTSEISRVIEKPAGIETVEARLETSRTTFDDQSLKMLVQPDLLQRPAGGQTATLRIFVLQTYQLVPTYAGLTISDDSIFLFMEAIRDVSDHQHSTANAEVSTLLHEFAHLLGARHVESSTCILSPGVENLTYGLPTSIRSTYCSLDLQEIHQRLNQKSYNID